MHKDIIKKAQCQVKKVAKALGQQMQSLEHLQPQAKTSVRQTYQAVKDEESEATWAKERSLVLLRWTPLCLQQEKAQVKSQALQPQWNLPASQVHPFDLVGKLVFSRWFVLTLILLSNGRR